MFHYTSMASGLVAGSLDKMQNGSSRQVVIFESHERVGFVTDPSTNCSSPFSKAAAKPGGVLNLNANTYNERIKASADWKIEPIQMLLVYVKPISWIFPTS